VGGKFLYAGGEKLYVRGVTYGAFRPDENGFEFPAEDVVAGDFGRMAENGVNTVRTYSVPPAWVLDLAQARGLRLMVGIPWEQHVAFLDERSRARSIEQRVRAAVRACAGHPAILCYVVGNEIPASIVRWHGRRRIERFIERLYRAAKAEDPEALVTYVNYPTTEYLRLPFLDLACFNVYLEEEEQLEVYVARLQYQVGDRPLLLTELGLDSGRHGEDAQAVSVGWQVRTAFRTGCVGGIVFSWTDEWHRGGRDIDDWHFGLTRAGRGPKPALAAVREAFEEAPFRHRIDWPSVSVIVCAYNEVRTLEDCLEGIERLDYPEFETIVVDDGSTDSTAEIAERFDVRLISTDNRGLSAARNTGIAAATGEIVAFIDADARPDLHWLRFIAAGLAGTPHGGIGGPNIAPASEGLVSESLQAVPGGPIHVLLSDREAEHVPGCNMAFRREALEEIGGFDPQFRIAGDDVDLCWRLRDAGWMIAFSPGAMVWHRRRGTIRGFLRQQREYAGRDMFTAARSGGSAGAHASTTARGGWASSSVPTLCTGECSPRCPSYRSGTSSSSLSSLARSSVCSGRLSCSPCRCSYSRSAHSSCTRPSQSCGQHSLTPARAATRSAGRLWRSPCISCSRSDASPAGSATGSRRGGCDGERAGLPCHGRERGHSGVNDGSRPTGG
jgi:GT2 family glycosyltransferase